MSDPSTRAFTLEQVRVRERYGPWAVVTGASTDRRCRVGRAPARRASIWSHNFRKPAVLVASTHSMQTGSKNRVPKSTACGIMSGEPLANH